MLCDAKFELRLNLMTLKPALTLSIYVSNKKKKWSVMQESNFD